LPDTANKRFVSIDRLDRRRQDRYRGRQILGRVVVGRNFMAGEQQ